MHATITLSVPESTLTYWPTSASWDWWATYIQLRLNIAATSSL